VDVSRPHRQTRPMGSIVDDGPPARAKFDLEERKGERLEKALALPVDRRPGCGASLLGAPRDDVRLILPVLTGWCDFRAPERNLRKTPRTARRASTRNPVPEPEGDYDSVTRIRTAPGPRPSRLASATGRLGACLGNTTLAVAARGKDTSPPKPRQMLRKGVTVGWPRPRQGHARSRTFHRRRTPTAARAGMPPSSNAPAEPLLTPR